jgi:hypothetical protein
MAGHLTTKGATGEPEAVVFPQGLGGKSKPLLINRTPFAKGPVFRNLDVPRGTSKGFMVFLFGDD